MRKLYLFLPVTILAILSFSANAQLYSYANDLAGTPTIVAVNATATNLTRYGSLTESLDACDDGFNSYRFSKSGTYTNYRPGIEFTITPDAGYQLNVNSISAMVRINPKGPTLWRMAYSTDGGATWTNNGEDLTVIAGTCDESNLISWDIVDFSATTSVVVRLIGFNAHSNLNGKGVLRDVVLNGTVTAADLDGDGYGSDIDCNDEDPSINPGATEICNGIDDNCNGDIDEGLEFTTYYADADGDGYGNADITTETCDGLPEGYVTDNTDCNDDAASINPGAVEICNEIDDNCDGNIDEGVLVTFYADADGDGYGNAAITTLACEAPEGYVSDNTDCDDATFTTNPGATEICSNSVDDNCNGLIDESDITASFEVIGDVPTCEGLGTYFSSTTPGADLTYQWYKNYFAIGGATSSDYVPTSAGYYQLEVNNGICTDITDTVHVIIKKAPIVEVTAELGTDLCGVDFVKLKCTPTEGSGSTYQWYQDGVAIAGATTDVIYPTAAGEYYVVVTGPNGCVTTSEITVVIASCKLGSNESDMVLQINPNPVSDLFTITLKNANLGGTIANLSIADLSGRIVYSISIPMIDGSIQEAINPGNLNPGVYNITVSVSSNHWNKQIVVVR